MNDHSSHCDLPSWPSDGSILATFQIGHENTFGRLLQSQSIRPHDLEHLLVFASTKASFEQTCSEVARLCPDTRISGATTAGQIGPHGYEDDEPVVIALPRLHFATTTVRIDADDLENTQSLIDRLVQARIKLAEEHPDKRNGFAFLLVDGLSLQEDILVSGVAPAMGPLPLFGGSAGDGTRFARTYLSDGESFGTALALLTFVYTDCETRVFSLNHLQPTGRKMVVTSADPEQRIVKEINAEPAAREYARIVDKDPEQLDEFTFSAFPVVVQLGDTHHVRSIQRVNENGELVFFSAIDEGMVLTLATPDDIARHLDRELSEINRSPDTTQILAFDCILRRIEAAQNQQLRSVSKVLAENQVVGFSTYGEQVGPLHVNHTMTGVMLSRPRV